MPQTSKESTGKNSVETVLPQVSAWTNSTAKRIFDVGAIVLFSPVILSFGAVIAGALRFSSSEPVFYRQVRVGRAGSQFQILKFRTMRGEPNHETSLIAACDDGRITRLGRLLRELKLDELPQVINILRGDMSLVGPRPRVPAQWPYVHDCRPGLTGAATLVFIHEASMLSLVSARQVPSLYEQAVIPAKRALDMGYQRHATFWSDLRIIVLSLYSICARISIDIPPSQPHFEPGVD